MERLDWLTSRPIAHRGLHDASRGIVENSGSAVAAAIDAGYAIEVDVQLTADGGAVVFHDETLERMTGETGPVVARTAHELGNIRYRGSRDCIQTVAGLLEQVSGRVPLVIEIKSLWGSIGPLEACVAEALAGYRGHAAAMSFDPRTVAELCRIAPAVPRGIVACRFDDRDDWPQLTAWRRFYLRHLLHAAVTRPHFISYDAAALPAPATRVARAFGVPVITWTVRSEAQREQVLCWADQITFEGFAA